CNFVAQAKPQADFAMLLPYGPANPGARALMTQARLRQTPAWPENEKVAFKHDAVWIAPRLAQLRERWTQWLPAERGRDDDRAGDSVCDRSKMFALGSRTRGAQMKRQPKLAPAIFAGALVAILHDAATAQTVAVATGAPGKVHLLPATMETTQLGWYDNAQKPVLTIKPGDSVVMETMMHFHDRLVPGTTLEMLAKIRQEVPGRGAHTLTGPVYVEGAEPGDVLKVKINKIVPRSYGVNMNYPGFAGQFPKEFPEGRIRYVYLDWDNKVAE